VPRIDSRFRSREDHPHQQIKKIMPIVRSHLQLTLAVDAHFIMALKRTGVRLQRHQAQALPAARYRAALIDQRLQLGQ